MIISTQQDLDIVREGGKRLAFIRDTLAKSVVVGATTTEINDLAHELCTENGDAPAFYNYQPQGASRPFPASVCISINDVVVHGIPNENPQTIKAGDLVTVDVGLKHKGIVTDTAVTVAVEGASLRELELVKTAERALSKAIDIVRVGARVGEISKVIEATVREKGFGIPEELGGHGVGTTVHDESPSIPNVHFGNSGPILSEGELIAIEPIITMGSSEILFDTHDGYTIRTKDGSKSAHAEHTVLVTETGVEIIT
ncbi:MAG: type I methionyl aminopeptidase [Candidatus Paceibacterota bacterium]